MKKKLEKEFQIVATNGTAVSLEDALSPVAINETEFPAWANDLIKEGCTCVVWTADCALGRFGGIKTMQSELKGSKAQMLVAYTASLIIDEFKSTYPSASEPAYTNWMKSTIVKSIRLEASEHNLHLYPIITEN